MDPWLEAPHLWPGVHQRLITSIARILNTALPPGFVADIGERVYVESAARDLYPDVLVLERAPAAPAGSGSAASAVAPPPPGGEPEPSHVPEAVFPGLPVG